MKIRADSPVLFSVFALVTILVVLIQGSQYFSESISLFMAVVVARLLVAVSAGVAACILLLICKLTFSTSLRTATILNVSGLLSAVVAIVMVIASRGTDISETLLEVYLMRG